MRRGLPFGRTHGSLSLSVQGSPTGKREPRARAAHQMDAVECSRDTRPYLPTRGKSDVSCDPGLTPRVPARVTFVPFPIPAVILNSAQNKELPVGS